MFIDQFFSFALHQWFRRLNYQTSIHLCFLYIIRPLRLISFSYWMFGSLLCRIGDNVMSSIGIIKSFWPILMQHLSLRSISSLCLLSSIFSPRISPICHGWILSSSRSSTFFGWRMLKLSTKHFGVVSVEFPLVILGLITFICLESSLVFNIWVLSHCWRSW